jgi:signal transduction histidine kinase
MAIRKKEERRTNAKPTRNDAAKKPLLETSPRYISDRQFAELFGLFYKAVSHETGNSLHTVQGLASRKGDDRLARLATAVHDSYRRITLLEHMARGDCFSGSGSLMLFSLVERKRLGLKMNDEGHEANIKAIKEIGLVEVRKFRDMLSELSKISETIEIEEDSMEEMLLSDMKRAVKYGTLLSNCLEKLMIGKLDLDADLISREVGSMFGDGKENDVSLNIFYQSEGLKDVLVMVNPIFAALILDNIMSNSKRAMEQKDFQHGLVVLVNREGGILTLEFVDRGCGMPQDVVDKLNTGVAVSTKEEPGEHGLGFQYCRELAEKMGGRLYVKRSVPGVGTNVVLELSVAN